jgi:hypothetical protein
MVCVCAIIARRTDVKTKTPPWMAIHGGVDVCGGQLHKLSGPLCKRTELECCRRVVERSPRRDNKESKSESKRPPFPAAVEMRSS